MFTINLFIVLVARAYFPGVDIVVISFFTLIKMVFITKFILEKKTYRNEEKFEKDGIKLFFSIAYFYIVVTLLYPNKFTVIFYIIIIFSFLYFIIKYFAFRKLNIWWKYIPVFGLLLFPSFLLIGFAMVPLQLLFGINDKTMIGVVIFFAIVVPIIVTLFEKKEKLIEIKVALFCISAVATTLSSIVFLFDDFLVGISLNYIIDQEINEEDISEFLLQEKDLDFKTFESIGLKKFAVEYYTLTIKNELENEITGLIDLVIKLLLLPPVVTTVWCFFIIELRVRKNGQKNKCRCKCKYENLEIEK